MMAVRVAERIRLDGKLHVKGDTVFIKDLNYNGTIIRFTSRWVVVLPHDYGGIFRRAISRFEYREGILLHQRRNLEERGVYYNDPVELHQGTFIHESRSADIMGR